MQIIKASEFKAKCLALMGKISRTGETVIITKNGKPIAELRPHRPRTENLAGVWKGRLIVNGDIVSPIGEDWEALK